MALARIVTRNPADASSLLSHLRALGYSIEVVSPQAKAAFSAELEISLERVAAGDVFAAAERAARAVGGDIFLAPQTLAARGDLPLATAPALHLPDFESIEAQATLPAEVPHVERVVDVTNRVVDVRNNDLDVAETAPEPWVAENTQPQAEFAAFMAPLETPSDFAQLSSFCDASSTEASAWAEAKPVLFNPPELAEPGHAGEEPYSSAAEQGFALGPVGPAHYNPLAPGVMHGELASRDWQESEEPKLSPRQVEEKTGQRERASIFGPWSGIEPTTLRESTPLSDQRLQQPAPGLAMPAFGSAARYEHGDTEKTAPLFALVSSTLERGFEAIGSRAIALAGAMGSLGHKATTAIASWRAERRAAHIAREDARRAEAMARSIVTLPLPAHSDYSNVVEDLNIAASSPQPSAQASFLNQEAVEAVAAQPADLAPLGSPTGSRLAAELPALPMALEAEVAAQPNLGAVAQASVSPARKPAAAPLAFRPRRQPAPWFVFAGAGALAVMAMLGWSALGERRSAPPLPGAAGIQQAVPFGPVKLVPPAPPASAVSVSATSPASANSPATSTAVPVASSPRAVRSRRAGAAADLRRRAYPQDDEDVVVVHHNTAPKAAPRPQFTSSGPRHISDQTLPRAARDF